MFGKSKFYLFLSLVATVIMIVAFLFVFFDVKKSVTSNTVKKEIKVTEMIEAEVTLLMGDVKKVVKKSYIPTIRSEFTLDNQKVLGWKLEFKEMDDDLLSNLHKFFEEHRYGLTNKNKITLKSVSPNNISLYNKDKIFCEIIVNNSTTVTVYCGYTK